MNSKSKIAILGGGGRTGAFLVAEFRRQQYPLRLLLRKPENFMLHHEVIEIVKGDALDLQAVAQLIKGCDAVISTIGQRKDQPLVASQATKNIIAAMEKYKIRRYIVLAGLNIETPFDEKGPQTISATAWMKANFPEIHEDRQKAYAILRESDLDWTLVRVPMIEFADRKDNINVSMKDCVGTSITARDIAEFLIQQLNERLYFQQAPFIAGA
jgi:putative NADH-flavin reductase